MSALVDTAMLDAALASAERGVPVFPVWWTAGGRCACGRADCASPAKHPIGALVPRGVGDATMDAAIIRSWWSRYPTANIGTPTSWATVLDVDPRHGGDDALSDLAGLRAERLSHIEYGARPKPDELARIWGVLAAVDSWGTMGTTAPAGARGPVTPR